MQQCNILQFYKISLRDLNVNSHRTLDPGRRKSKISTREMVVSWIYIYEDFVAFFSVSSIYLLRFYVYF